MCLEGAGNAAIGRRVLFCWSNTETHKHVECRFIAEDSDRPHSGSLGSYFKNGPFNLNKLVAYAGMRHAMVSDARLGAADGLGAFIASNTSFNAAMSIFLLDPLAGPGLRRCA